MIQWTDAQDWIDLIDHIWIGLVLIAIAVLPALISSRKTNQGIKKIQDQVVNGHTDPLRSDLDKVIQKLNETSNKVDLISSDVQYLRTELGKEEGRRVVSDNELRDDFDRRFTEVLRKFIK